MARRLDKSYLFGSPDRQRSGWYQSHRPVCSIALIACGLCHMTGKVLPVVFNYNAKPAELARLPRSLALVWRSGRIFSSCCWSAFSGTNNLAYDGVARRFKFPRGEMADQSTSEPVVPLPPATEGGERHDQPDLTGQNILSLLHQATDLAGGNSRYAVELSRRNSRISFARLKIGSRNWKLESQS